MTTVSQTEKVRLLCSISLMVKSLTSNQKTGVRFPYTACSPFFHGCSVCYEPIPPTLYLGKSTVYTVLLFFM